MSDDPKKTSGSARRAEQNTQCIHGGDRLLLGPLLPNGQRSYVRHRADHTLEQGVCSDAKDGEPLLGRELLTLTHDPSRGNYIVENSYSEKGAAARSHKGPSRVTTKAYDEGWARTFGGSKPS